MKFLIVFSLATIFCFLNLGCHLVLGSPVPIPNANLTNSIAQVPKETNDNTVDNPDNVAVSIRLKEIKALLEDILQVQTAKQKPPQNNSKVTLDKKLPTAEVNDINQSSEEVLKTAQFPIGTGKVAWDTSEELDDSSEDWFGWDENRDDYINE